MHTHRVGLARRSCGSEAPAGLWAWAVGRASVRTHHTVRQWHAQAKVVAANGHAHGHAHGHANGHAHGHARGHAHGRIAISSRMPERYVYRPHCRECGTPPPPPRPPPRGPPPPTTTHHHHTPPPHHHPLPHTITRPHPHPHTLTESHRKPTPHTCLCACLLWPIGCGCVASPPPLRFVRLGGGGVHVCMAQTYIAKGAVLLARVRARHMPCSCSAKTVQYYTCGAVTCSRQLPAAVLRAAVPVRTLSRARQLHSPPLHTPHLRTRPMCAHTAHRTHHGTDTHAHA